jgi:hypothetical protein
MKSIQILLIEILFFAACKGVGATDRLEFNRDVRPILSDNCFYCHGPDANHRQADLRLDVRESAVAHKAITPENPDLSELVQRVLSSDPEHLMPPPTSNKKLSERDKEILKRWIAEGAEYQQHWSFEKPVKPAVPPGSKAIDFLIAKRHSELDYTTASEADRRVLIRRLYFDLIGLPPTPQEVEDFVGDRSDNAYEKLVDRLIQNPHYGERMAIGWLDVVRFADTIGYHSDNPRNIWPYRDWVIRSFNSNKSFDRFTLEQIAGDLLPDANQETLVGSAFNRLLLTTEEGGAQAKDYEQRMLTDRVRAIGAAWLGLTTGCAQCHDHKFDPFTMRDFYSLGAFFADIKEPILGRREDGMMVLDETQSKRHRELIQALEGLQRQFDAPIPELAQKQDEWEASVLRAVQEQENWKTLPVDRAISRTKNVQLKVGTDHVMRATVDPKRNNRNQNDGTDIYDIRLRLNQAGVTAFRLEALKEKSAGIGLASNGNFVLNEITILNEEGESIEISDAVATFEQPNFSASQAIDGIEDKKENGWAVLGGTGSDQSIYLKLKNPIVKKDSIINLKLVFHWGENHEIANLRISETVSDHPLHATQVTVPPKELIEILRISRSERSPDQHTKVLAAFKQVVPELADLRTQIGHAQKSKADFEQSIPKCLVTTSDTKKRIVRILPRGNWMDESGEMMKPALPGFLVKQSDKNEELNRLDLARWLVSRENPLTARTVMNRLWKQFFGIGLSRVLDDLGAQGEPPIHSELLDWLASEFMDSGWDMKHMVRLIVTSSLYKQSSNVSSEQVALDPANREITRQSAIRLDAELVRDNALAISGLLIRKIGGPSAKPYQPEGYWENLNFPQRTYPSDQGEMQYRRGLYTWWQRSFLHPSMLAFDAPNREECCAERNRSNIPQQALVLLNDPSYVEAARAFAIRIQTECRGTTTDRLTWAWQQALQRKPSQQELATMLPIVEEYTEQYRRDTNAANLLLQVGMSKLPSDGDRAEIAAWTHISRILLNLHETITRP